MLAGGEGRRMLGRDKGLIDWQGQALAEHGLRRLAPQCARIGLLANRNADAYRAMLQRCRASDGMPWVADAILWPRVLPDDPDLPPRSGPMAGFVTALRHTSTAWAMIVPCDVPHLPADLVSRLLCAAADGHARVVVPATIDHDGTVRRHWVCALVHQSECPDLEQAFVTGARKVGLWAQSRRWVQVCFDDPSAFQNMNTPESLSTREPNDGR